MWMVKTPDGFREIRFVRRGKPENNNVQYSVYAGDHHLGVVMPYLDGGWTSIPDPRIEDRVSLDTLRAELTRYGRMIGGFRTRQDAVAHILYYLGYWEKGP